MSSQENEDVPEEKEDVSEKKDDVSEKKDDVSEKKDVSEKNDVLEENITERKNLLQKLTDKSMDILPLVNPVVIPKSSKDPNRGLYPRKRQTISKNTFNESKASTSSSSGFSLASELYKSRLNFNRNENLNSTLHENRLNNQSLATRLNTSTKDDSTPSCSYACDNKRSHNDELNESEPKRKRKKPELKSNTLRNYYQKREDKEENVNRISLSLSVNNNFAVTVNRECSSSNNSNVTRYHPQVRLKLGNGAKYNVNLECNSSKIEMGKNKDNEDSSIYDFGDASIPENYWDENSFHEFKNEKLHKDNFAENSASTSSYVKNELSPSATSQQEEIKDKNLSEKSDAKNKLGENIDEKYYFGLFGSNECDEECTGENYFQYLPVPVMEQILSQVPFLHLKNLRLVCKSWNEIISNDNFVQWKKAYYEVKLRNQSLPCWKKALENGIGSSTLETCFISLITYVSEHFKRKLPQDFETFFLNIPECQLAKLSVMERFIDWDHEHLNSWCILATVILLSKTVDELYKVMTTLLKHHSNNGEDIMEFLYCVATMLLHYMRHYFINHGLHYRLYYVIYLLENDVVATLPGTPSIKAEQGKPGQQSMLSYCDPLFPKMTSEQIQILNHRLKPNQRIKIIAFAGSGKTSVLIQFARLYPNLTFLNIMFNKAVCDYASKKFPLNVTCRTAHSVAYSGVGKLYRHKLNFKLKPYNIITQINKPEGWNMNIYSYAKFVLQTIESFTASVDEFITVAHVPRKIRQPPGFDEEHSRRINNVPIILCDDERLKIAEEATQLWGKMADKNNVNCRITHDIYLKMFQLTHPTLSGYDCIMVDEAQDCDAAILDIVTSQKVPLIFVGDPNQQIYGFRGARRALNSIESTHTYYLTKSFRFGPEIAYVASSVIETLKWNTKTTLVGSLKESYVDGTAKGQCAIIARTNHSLFNEVVRLCCTNERRSYEPDVIQAAFAGGINSYGFDQLVDIYKLKNDDTVHSEIKCKFIRKFGTFQEFYNYTKRTDDNDMLCKIDLVFKYGQRIIEIVNNIKQKCGYSLELANVVFTTAHKSKGLEFDTVALVNDFQIGDVLRDPLLPPDSSLSEEYNILYVALTRAKKCLILNEMLFHTLVRVQEKFQYPYSKEKLDSPLVCVSCSVEFIPRTNVILHQKQITMTCGRVIRGGFLCMRCATKPKYSPEVHRGPAIMLIDSICDVAHMSMSCFVGPLPSDSPMVHEDLSPFNVLENFPDFDHQQRNQFILFLVHR